MMSMTRLLSLTFALLLLVAPQAHAQPPVKATNANPKANLVFAADVSGSMYDPAGNGLRRYENIRGLAAAGSALDYFKYDFNYGFFAYTAARTLPHPNPALNANGNGDNGNRHAQIVDDWGLLFRPMRPGSAANPVITTSWTNVRDRLANVDVYDRCKAASGKGWSNWSCLEHTTRGGVTGTPTLMPNGDLPAGKFAEKAAMEAILDYYSNPANNPGAGMFIPTLQTSSTGVTYTSTPCDSSHPLAPAGAFPADGSANMAMCGPTPCFNGWHRAYIDQYVMTGVELDQFDFYFELFHELNYWAWPRYLGQPSDAEVDADFCLKLGTPFANIKSKLDDCLPPGPKSDRYWAGAGFTCNPTTLANTICNGTGPNGGSPFFTENTCVCFPNQAGCGMGGSLPDDCSVNTAGIDVLSHMNGIPANSENPVPGSALPVANFPYSGLVRPYVQAEAMCYSERPTVGLNYQSSITKEEPNFRTDFRDQPGNVLNAGNKCKANVVAFLTDGVGGNGSGITNHAAINRFVYKSRNRDGTYYPENHVFHATDRAVGYDFAYVAYADAMSQTISGGVRPQAHNLAQPKLTAAALAGIFNRTQAGQYSTAPLVFDRFGTRVGVISYEIPGRYAGQDFSKYLGRPSRLSWYSVDDTGTITGLLWETDWKSLTDNWPGGVFGAGYSARFFYGGPGAATSFTATDGTTHNVAMNTQWSATHTTVGGNGWTRFRSAGLGPNTTDRNGDGVVNGADAHPQLAWGGMLGADNAKPVIVEAPIDPPGIGNSDFQSFVTAPGISDRPRVVYVQANEFLHAIHAGTRNAAAPPALGTQLGGLSQNREFDYNDAANPAGTELWRFRPGFLRHTPNVNLAGAMHYTLMNGTLVTQDVKWKPLPAIAPATTKYATLLVMTQGASGRGLAVLDVTRPHQNLGSQAAFVTVAATKKVIFDDALRSTPGVPPTDDVVSTTAEPQIVDWPGTGAAANRVALVMTSGWTAAPTAATPKKILVYQLTNVAGYTSLQAGSVAPMVQITVPVAAGATLASGARCVNFGKEFACYALDTTGHLWRARVNLSTGAFIAPAVDVTALAGGGVDHTRTYNSLPAFYFGADNAINIVFGSGDPNDLRTTSGTDEIYRIRDASLSGGTGAYLNADVCKDNAGSTSGIIPIGAGERLLTNPVVSGGVVAWTTFRPQAAADECGVGNTYLYAMDFQTCADAVFGSVNPRPAGQDLGDGVPSSPSVLGRSGALVAHTSKQVTAAGINGSVTKVNTRGFLRKPIQRVYRLWWRRKAL